MPIDIRRRFCQHRHRRIGGARELTRPTQVMTSVIVSSITGSRPSPLSHFRESSELKPAAGTVDVGSRLSLTGFPVGFGGWTAAQLYERNVDISVSNNSSQQQQYHETDVADAVRAAARQQVMHESTPIARLVAFTQCGLKHGCGSRREQSSMTTRGQIFTALALDFTFCFENHF